jgi:hypothetical protein
VKQPATVEFVAPEPIQAEATVLNQDSPGGQGRPDAQQSSAAGGDNPLHYEEDTE